jgi:hypothetical protein
MNEMEYLKLTSGLMGELGIPIRDTFSFERNLDDFYTNGQVYGGQRHFMIESDPAALVASMSANKTYEVPSLLSVAYDRYRISVPPRLQAAGRDDPVIHECVHFLQHNTTAEERSYIKFACGSEQDYRAYLSQRVEREAHLVQVDYITKYCRNYMATKLTAAEITEVHRLLAACGKGAPLEQTLELLMYCTTKGLIGLSFGGGRDRD